MTQISSYMNGTPSGDNVDGDISRYAYANLQRNYGGGSNPGVFDASYTIDSRNRLTRTQEGHWNGSSISTLWRDQQWTLSQTGNWATDKEDLNGDGDFTDSGEVDDTRTRLRFQPPTTELGPVHR